MTTKFRSGEFLNIKKIINNIAAQLTGSTVSYGINAIVLLFIAREVGPAQYGAYSSSFVLTFLASILFNLGLDLWLLKEGGEKPNEIRQLAGSVLFIKLILGFIWVCGFIIIAHFLNSQIFPKGIVRLSALTVWANSIFLTALVPFRALQKNKISSFIESISSLTWLAIIFGFIRNIEIDIYDFVQVLMYFTVVKSLISLFFLRKRVGFIVSKDTVINGLKQSIPYASSDFLAWIFMRLDIVLVAMILGNFQAGIYSPSVGIINALFLIPSAVHIVIVPILSNLFTSDLRLAWRFFARSTLIFLLLGVGLFIATWFGADIYLWF